MDKLIIDTIDFYGNRVIFTEKKWKEKSTVHPELKNKTFLKNLEDTIKNPEEIWEDNSDKKNKRCYYKKYSIVSYVKVVIWINGNPCHIVSAFETNKIKEQIYSKFKKTEMTTQNKKEFLDLATGFNLFANKHGWVSRYDTESDALSITVPKLSSWPVLNILMMKWLFI